VFEKEKLNGLAAAHTDANVLTKDELVEAITHLAFYSGWPTAVSAAMIARDVFKPEG
jgi:alkylhydroperoxidase/carboxymuconolactone decarboxylase family protein YurZ